MSKQLQGQDVVIAAISPAATLDQIPLANAAKLVGVKRFVPCFFAPVTAPTDVIDLRHIVGHFENHPGSTYDGWSSNELTSLGIYLRYIILLAF